MTVGVVIHVLDRRRIRLEIAGNMQEIGALRHLSKVTELDERRIAELGATDLLPSPPAAMVAHPVDLPLALGPEGSVAAHPVIGWDDGRVSVTDLDWDYLPVLGYALRDAGRDMYVLHELQQGVLHGIDPKRACELGLLANGVLRPQWQPLISECLGVKPFMPGFAEADCTFENGRRDRLLIRVLSVLAPVTGLVVARSLT